MRLSHSLYRMKNRWVIHRLRLDCMKKGFQDDRCVLYVFRCAVYFAEHEQHEPEKLKWWYWKDKDYPERCENQ
jgi:hypothetical protein